MGQAKINLFGFFFAKQAYLTHKHHPLIIIASGVFCVQLGGNHETLVPIRFIYLIPKTNVIYNFHVKPAGSW
jgi:quercetin dioxygenase-like cupin family protein